MSTAPHTPYLRGDLALPSNATHRANFVRLLEILNAAARDAGEIWHVNDGYRPFADQVKEWAKYAARGFRPPLVARPGTSNHGRGLAADVSAEDGSPVGAEPRHRKVLAQHGLCLPVPGELWHVERGNTWVAAARP